MLNRRESLQLIAGTAAALLTGGAFASRLRGAVPANPTPTLTAPLVLTPEQEEGPFYIAAERIRRDITEGRPGLPLDLRVTLVDVADGKPVSGAALDIWHCDASGTYSGFANMKMGPPPDDDSDVAFLRLDDGPPGPPPDFHGGPGGPGHHMSPTDKSTFLRGVQITDAAGQAAFTTIYPGWYAGREIHIHLKVHLDGVEEKGAYTGGHVCHTGQLFFPDEANVTVSKLEPYVSSKTERTTKDTDHVYLEENGAKMLVMLRPLGKDPVAGYRAEMVLAVDRTATPQPVGMHG